MQPYYLKGPGPYPYIGSHEVMLGRQGGRLRPTLQWGQPSSFHSCWLKRYCLRP